MYEISKKALHKPHLRLLERIMVVVSKTYRGKKHDSININQFCNYIVCRVFTLELTLVVVIINHVTIGSVNKPVKHTSFFLHEGNRGRHCTNARVVFITILY